MNDLFPIAVILAFLLGSAMGSFANVLAYRIPLGKSVVSPPSACPRCSTPIQRRDNIPVFGWLLLRAKCRACSAPISAQYPVVELLTGLLFVLVVWKIEPGLWPLLFGFAFVSVVLSLIDIQTRRLPNKITYPAFAYGIVTILVAVILGVDASVIARSCLAALALFSFYALVWFVYPRGIGLGDVKLAPTLGLVLGVFGWGAVIVGAFAGFVLGSVVGVIAMVRAKKASKVAIPFGPSMIAGAWFGIVAGQDSWDMYLSAVGLA